MKRHCVDAIRMILGPLAGGLGLLALLAPGAAAQPPCATRTLQGQYVFTGRGFIEPGDPGVQCAAGPGAAGGGRADYDSRGGPRSGNEPAAP